MLRTDPRNPRGIVWIASYPRSGNTWMRVFLNGLYQLLFLPGPVRIDLNRMTNLEESDLDLARFEALLKRRGRDLTREMIAAARPQVQLKIATDAKGLVLVKTHNAMIADQGTPLINRQASAGGIYIVRNPLDCALSLADFRGIPVDQAIADMATPGFANFGSDKSVYWICGSWSENVASWTETPGGPIHVVRYEDMLEKPDVAFGGVAAHLGLAPRPDQTARAVELARFDALQSSEREHGFSERPRDNPVFFRAGRAGQWRERLTPAQVDRIVAAHGTQMRRFGYLPDRAPAPSDKQ